MMRLPRRVQSRDLRFLGLLGLSLLLVGLYLGETLERAAHPGRGHRRIDLKTLERRIDAGDLRDREADWYHGDGQK
jgi:hypothetical protein